MRVSFSAFANTARSSVILELMTREHGRHFGLVHGGRSRTRQPVFSPAISSRPPGARGSTRNLGIFQVEGLKLRAAEFIASPMALYGLATLSHLLRYLPERDPHTALYETLADLVDNLADADLAPTLFVAFELSILAEFGFGLDLGSCAATGTRDDLVYVSPRSGRAVAPRPGSPTRIGCCGCRSFLVGQSRANRPRAGHSRCVRADGFLSPSVRLRASGRPAPAERARFIALATLELK